MPTEAQSKDEALVESIRRLCIDRRKLRRGRFLSGSALIALSIVLTAMVVRKIGSQGTAELGWGFFTGIFLAFLCSTSGFLGAFLLAKALSGFDGGLRMQELLVRYHDRLHELGALPDMVGCEPDAAPNGGPAKRSGNS